MELSMTPEELGNSGDKFRQVGFAQLSVHFSLRIAAMMKVAQQAARVALAAFL